jgi:hypothetical protein
MWLADTELEPYYHLLRGDAADPEVLLEIALAKDAWNIAGIV